ncbi:MULTISPECIES: DUF4012 domain-containing protein [Microbacterium]|uniref:DUF4012 domain-containing protein n=1 Tax=Microbacterium TaxID=33882 RepID=UPI00344F7D6E
MTPTTRREARQQPREQGETTERPRRRLRIKWVLAILLVVVLLCAAWLAFRALTVKNALESAQSALQQAQEGGDVAGAIDIVAREAGNASSAASDPIWAAAEILPFVGENLRGVRLASQSLDVVANDIGKPILDMQGDGEGAILSRALPVIERGAELLAPLRTDLASLSSSTTLLAPVQSGVTQVNDVVGALQPVLAIMPGLLGADEAKNYLLVFQNNAETLPLGGSAASETMIRADAGDLEITGQGSSGIFDRDKRDIGIEISEPLRELYGKTYGTRVNMSTTRPDWPAAAQMVAAFWNRTIDDTRVDGAVSIDPLALARILKATGPITVPGPDGDFELNEGNANDVLLSKVYQWWDAYTPEGALASDKFFGTVASTVFNSIASGDFNLKDMAWAVSESVETGSVMAWMADAQQQSFIESAGKISGILPSDNTDETVVGVYFRDVSASKIDYYLDAAVDATMSCADGVTTLTTKATAHLAITQADAENLPRYVQSFRNGANFFSKHFFVYAPPGMELVDTKTEGEFAEPFRQGNTDLGRAVVPFQSRVAPGETVTVEATFTGTGDFGPLAVRTTPTVRGTDVVIDDSCR